MSESTKQNSGLAIAGLVLGIIAAATSFLPIVNNLSFFIALIGGILAAISLVGALKGKHAAKGLSIAGVVLAIVSCVVVLVTQSAYKTAIDTAVDKATNGSQPVATTSEGAGAPEPAATESTQQDFSNLPVGTSVTLDNGTTITVNSVQTGLSNYDGSVITCANVTIVNNGSSNASFNQYDWKGEDANGAQRSTTYYSDQTDELSSGSLSPGGSVTGNVYFDDGIVRILYYSNMFNKGASAGWVL